MEEKAFGVLFTVREQKNLVILHLMAKHKRF
jgi:hypothetical protein